MTEAKEPRSYDLSTSGLTTHLHAPARYPASRRDRRDLGIEVRQHKVLTRHAHGASVSQATSVFHGQADTGWIIKWSRVNGMLAIVER